MKFLKHSILLVLFLQGISLVHGQHTLLIPDQVFDGMDLKKNWVVLVYKDSIKYAGPNPQNIPPGTNMIKLPGTTLLPGLIEGHAHLLLHPYNETSWDDQVLKESRAERTLRAGAHARASLMAGFTTVRDLGTEGAGYDDAGIKTAIEKGIIPGPRLLIASKAIVAKGAYGPRSGSADTDYPQGAAEVANEEEMRAEVRSQISKGADIIKIYADYRKKAGGPSNPTFTVAELKAAVEIAALHDVPVVTHAGTKEGMLNSIAAGVKTIEHGDLGDAEIFRSMKEKGIALCPTLAATEATEEYRGWKKGSDPETSRIIQKKKMFQTALASGVIILMGGDVGVFAHGDNAREMELMVAYGMKPIDVLRSSTSINADALGISNLVGRIQSGKKADIIIVNGDPVSNISTIRKVILVMKDGKIYKTPLVEGK